MPKISVVMPVYNGEKYLREAMDSILGQTYTDFEFIIIDDGSKDSSAEIVRSYDDPRIRFHQNEHNMGVAATLNRGLDLATGEYIARMDADDISLPERFAKQVAYMDEHPEVAVCGCDIELFGARYEKRIFAREPKQMRADMFFSCGLAHPTAMMRGELFGPGGFRYNEQFSKMEDYALWLEVLEKHDISCMPEVLLKYRIHPGQVTNSTGPEVCAQAQRLKERQLKKLRVETCGEKYDAFVKYCGGTALSESETAALIVYLRMLSEANANAKLYDVNGFKVSLDAVKRRALDRLPVRQAARTAAAAGENGAAYTVGRFVRGRRATLMSVVSAARKRSHLKNHHLTIISNNCWGGFIYQKYGLKYSTPTIGLYIPGDDFVRFCANLHEYLNKELSFIAWERARLYPQIGAGEAYPVALLGDVEIYFMHYRSEDEAREKWERRKKRINPDRLIFKLSQRECCTQEDVEAFLSLPLEHKICFAYDEVPGAVHIPELRDLAGDETALVEKYFNELDYLNRL